jgi:RNA polymerase subunit RPABC4/transcription elongation factor Spt4
MAEEPSEEIKQYFCSECGVEIKEDDVICPNCGSDLSETIDENQSDVFVTLNIAPNAITAEHIRKLLEAHGIKSGIRVSPTTENAEAVSVLVSAGNLENAENILKDPANESRKMLLSDIFSLTFSIAGKNFKNNAILASASIPAILIFIISVNVFLSSFKYTTTNSNKLVVWPVIMLNKEISKDTYLDATAGFNNKILFTYPDDKKDLVKLNDTIWVLADNNAQASFRGYISRIEEGYKSDNKAYVDPCDMGTSLEPGTRYKVEFKDPAHKIIHCIEKDAVYEKDGHSFVHIMVNGRVKSVYIKTGVKSGYYIEILSGVSSEDTIITGYFPGQQLPDDAEVTTQIPQENLKIENLTTNIILLSISIIFLIIAVAAVYYGVTKAAGLTIEKKEYSIKQIFKSIFSTSFLKAMASGAALVVFVAGPYATAFLLISMFGNNAFIKMIGIFLILLSIPWIVYASVKYCFTFVHTVVSGEGVINSFKKSGFLVKEKWGRTFGILILISLVTGLITSLLSTPIAFFMSWDFFLHPEVMGGMNLSKTVWRTFAVTSVVNIILKGFIDPVFTTVMYYDLKNRKNEFYF